MSFRDIRNFSEAMRALGFPRQISMESFRSPNLELMEECLRWLASRLEPDAVLAGGRHSVEQRIAMVTHAIALFHSRANLKLNGRRLYGADGWAARELLKVAALLRASLAAPAPDDFYADVPVHYDVSARLGDIKQARSLATEITAQGALLYDLLAKEPDNKEHREQALSRPLDMAAMEACLRRALEGARREAAAARARVEGVAASEAALDAKLERRRAELLRAEKRLLTVQKIRPAYQGELTALEGEIEQAWDDYVLRFRCVEALKHQLSLLETAQAEAAEEQQAAIMQLIHKYEAEDVLGKLSDSEDSESSEGNKPSEPSEPAARPRTRTRLRIKTAGVPAAEARRVYGSMQAAGGGGVTSLDDERDDHSHTDDDLSDDVYAGDAGGAGAGAAWSRSRTMHSDDDFADLIDGADGSAGGSLGSSSESELRLTPARAARSSHPGRPERPERAGRSGRSSRRSVQPRAASAVSDNEF